MKWLSNLSASKLGIRWNRKQLGLTNEILMQQKKNITEDAP